MMHECPRCKFVQPKDQYCANCGLDIDAYVPVPEPLIRRLARSTTVQICLVVLAVLIGGGLIFYSQKEKLAQHLNSATTNPPRSLLDAQPALDPVVTASDSTAGAISADTLPPAATSEGAGLQAAADVESPDTANSADQKKLVVTFVEASNTILQQLASDGQILNESAQRRSFTVGGIDSVNQLKERDMDFRVLPRAMQSAIRMNIPILADFTHISSAATEDVGLSLEITPISQTDGNLELTLLGNIHLKDEAGGTIVNQDINANYVFSSRNTLVMVGFLPRQSVRAEDLSGFSNTPLVIYESLNFLNGVTDFAIFIQAK